MGLRRYKTIAAEMKKTEFETLVLIVFGNR